MEVAGRALVSAALLMLATACQQEPDFDERYQAAQDKIRDKAVEIDSELAKAQRRRAAEETGTGTGTAVPGPASDQ